LLEHILEEAGQASKLHQMVEIEQTMSTTSEGLLADCCRLAGLIYCELVLFPSLYDIKLLSRLTEDLRTALETLDFWSSGTDETQSGSDVLIWATMLGAMAESSKPRRTWFVRKLSVGLSSDQRLWNWPSMGLLLSKFLWWQPVCDQLGHQVWQEAINFRQLVIASKRRPEMRNS
jgi:hypothetical protein